MQPLIKTENLQYTYPRESADEITFPVLRGVDLTVQRGEYVAILGHNGSGKSTFAKLLNLILEPTEGKIYIDGQDVTSPDMTDEDVYALRRRIGMVFQNPDNQLVATLVEEDVAFGPENLGLEPAEIRRRVDEALDMVGMREYAQHEPHRLSGGQKQRVAIAGVIAMMPECMILDEATSSIDTRTEAIVQRGMDKLMEGRTVFVIAHRLSTVRNADRIAVVEGGRIVELGSHEELMAKNEAEIRSVVLADEVVVGSMDGIAKEWNLNGEDVTIGVKRV